MIVASYVLHYGAEYLAWSIRSIQDVVDEIQVFYTKHPSFGFYGDSVCPESEELLKEQAHRFLSPGKKLHWFSGNWGREGEHRDTAVAAAVGRGAKQVVVVDADEVWNAGSLARQLELSREAGIYENHVRFVHFWRSFDWVCRDPSMPLRIINPSGARGNHWYGGPEHIPVLHFGYAQSEAIVKYKVSVHGHKSEWRPEWMGSKFLAWRPGDGMIDVHPTCGYNAETKVYFWTPEVCPAGISSEVSSLLGDHQFFGMEIIR